MTKRKPPSVSFPDWVEQQIRAAEGEGAFANLPGAGRPIPGIDRPQDELAWVAGYLRRENTDAAPLLPPALALAKEVEGLAQRLVRERSEDAVRAIVRDLNERILLAHARPQTGPPLRVRTVRVEDAVTRWRADRAALDAALAAAQRVEDDAAQRVERDAAQRAALNRAGAVPPTRRWSRFRRGASRG